MNKYQEAFEYITAVTRGRVMVAQLKVLKELVDKSTPTKPILLADKGFDIEVSAHLCCPNCKQPIVNVWSSREYKPKYCHYCGQSLDRSGDNGK